MFGTSKSFTVTRVTEWFWQFDAKYELIVFMGNEPEKGIVIASREGHVELKTSADATPKPVSLVRPNLDVNLSWFLAHLSDSAQTNAQCEFIIIVLC